MDVKQGVAIGETCFLLRKTKKQKCVKKINFLLTIS